MDFLDVIILSIVEGITEFLPISSTAHLILTSQILGIPVTKFLGTFEIAIQLGAISAVVAIYYRKLFSDRTLFYKACVGFIPTGILGFLFYDYIKMLLNNAFVTVAALLIGGLFIIGMELLLKKKVKSKEQKEDIKNKTKSLDNLTYKDALIVGLAQSISMIPGTSRAAVSIFTGMALKFDRKSAVEFSFLLAIPTMLSATVFDIAKTSSTFTTQEIVFLISGIIFSFISALMVIKWLLKYVQKNDFIGFGVYRIVLAVVYYLVFLR